MYNVVIVLRHGVEPCHQDHVHNKRIPDVRLDISDLIKYRYTYLHTTTQWSAHVEALSHT
jgi:hypothetical protein